MQNVTTGNRDTVIRTMIAEAGREGPRGLQAVSSVMFNRAAATGLSMDQIARQRGQFEPHMTEAGRARMASYRPGSAVWRAAEAALDRSMAGDDPTGGADHFYAPVAQAAATDGRAAVPRWAVGKTGNRIGNHVFYSLGYGNRTAPRAGAQTGASLPGTSVPTTPDRPPMSAGEALSGSSGGTGPTRGGTLTGEAILGGALPAERPVRSNTSGAAKGAWQAILERDAGPYVDRRISTERPVIEAQNAQSLNSLPISEANSITGLDRLSNSVVVNTPIGAAATWLRDTLELGIVRDDPTFRYDDNLEDIEKDRTRRQVDELRTNAGSMQEVERIRMRQDEDAARLGEIGGGVSGFLYNAGGSVLDPIGIAAGLGVGSVLKVANMGSRVYALNGQRAALTGSLAAEGAAGAGLTMAALDAAGTYVSPGDYVAALAAGGAMGMLTVPFVSRGGNREARATGLIPELPARGAAPDRPATEALNEARDAAAGAEIAVLAKVEAQLGPNATPTQIAKAAEDEHVAAAAAPILDTINPIPEHNRFTSPNHQPDPAKQARLEAATDLVRDPTERGLIMQQLERAETIDLMNPHTAPSDAMEALWRKTGLSSTGLTMLRSNSPFMRGVSKILGEGASGHSGRRHSVAMDASINEQAFMNPMQGWEANIQMFRREQGAKVHTRYTDGGEFNRMFDDRVALEMRNRARPDLYAPDPSPAIQRAADMAAETYRLAGEAQVKWKTVGSQNIEVGDKSYFQQSLDPAKLLKLSRDDPARLSEYRVIYADQGRQIFGWDEKFADEFSRGYMAVALDKATGGYRAPANLSHHSAGDIVLETLRAMRETSKGAAAGRLDKEIAKFARGGASFTKKRLDWDVTNPYRAKDGSEIRLLDLASTDILAMTRAYARRAAGEIGLHKAGIEGRHGADLMRRAAQMEVAAGRATQKELDAFDQIMSELMGTEFSKAVRVPFLQNLNMITSAVKLGGMAITQFGETANAMATIGVSRTVAMVPNAKRLYQQVQAMRKGEVVDNGWLNSMETEQGFGFGMESYILDRGLDNRDAGIDLYGQENIGLISKASRGAAHLNAIYSGQRVMTAVQTRFMAEEIARKAVKFIRSGKQDRALLDMGLTPELREALKANIDLIAPKVNGKVPVFNIRAGNLTPAQISEFVGVIHRGAGQIIQKNYVGETGIWAHNDVLKSLLQFRTFSLVSTEKQWGRNIRTMGHAKAFAFMVASTSIAMPLHMARVHAKAIGMEDAERQEYLERELSFATVAQASMSYASSAGFLGDLWNMGGSAASDIAGDAAPEWLQATANPRGSGRPQDFLGGAVMPSASLLQDTFDLAHGDWAKLRSLLPGGSLPVVVPALNVAEGAMTEE